MDTTVFDKLVEDGIVSKEDFITIPAGSGKEIKIPATIGDISVRESLDHMMAGARKQGKTDTDKQLEDLLSTVNKYKNDNIELTTAVRKFEDEKLSTEDRVKVAYQRQIDESAEEVKKANAKMESIQNEYNNLKINDQIMKEFSKYDLFNSEQAASLVKVGASINDKGEVIFGENITPKDFIESWVKDPNNGHHLRSKLKPGNGGTQGNNTTGSGLTKVTRTELRDDPEKKKQYREQVAAGQEVEIVDQ